MTAKLSRSRRVWRDFCRAGAALSAVMLGVSVVSVLSAQALPAGTAPVAGQVVSVTSGSTTSTWGLTLTSPDNKCPGDGLAGFKWSTYFVPASVDVATLTYNNFGPVAPAGVSSVFPLYSATGSSPQINKNPSLGDGLISGTPAAFSFAPIADQSVPNGQYKIGYACHKDGQTERYWQTSITVSGSTATGFNFTVAGGPTTTTTTVAGSTTTTTNSPPTTAEPTLRAPVTNLVASPSAGQLAISWTPPTGPTPQSYRLTIFDDGVEVEGSPFWIIPSQSAFTKTNLTSGSYLVTVTPTHWFPFSAPSSSVSAVVASGVPDAPVLATGLTVDNATLSGSFTHSASTPVTLGYIVEAVPSSPAAVVMKALGPGARSFSLTAADGIVNGATYAVVVRATNAVGSSAPSNSVTSPVVAPVQRAGVTNLVVTPTGGQLVVSWTAPTGPAPTGYRVVVGYVMDFYATVGLPFNVGASTTSLTLTGLAAGSYVVTVTPQHASPFTALSASTSVFVVPTVGVVPAAPVLVSPLTVGDATVGGTFTHAVSDPPTTGYTVTATPASGSVVTKVLAAGSTSFSLTATDGIVNGTTYTVVVRATNSAGTSAASNSVTSPTVAPPPRAAVTNLVATPTSGQLAITWTAPTGPAPTGYQVAITVGGTGITGSPFSAEATVSAFTRTGLAAGSYVVTVTPQHASPFTALPASTPAVTVPAAPTAPAAPVLVSPLTVGDATVGGTFTHAVSDPVTTGYTVTATPGTGSVVTKVLAAGATSFSLTTADGIVNGTTYTVVVRATNSAGTSAPSNSVTSPTVAPPPRAAVTNLVATPTSGQLAITWTVPAGPAPTGYQVAITVGGTGITGSPFSAEATVSAFTRTGLAAGSYVVTVTPQHASPFIALSASTSAVTVPAVGVVPAAPVLVSPLTVGDATVGGTFTHAVSDPPTTGYTVTATPGTGSVVTKVLAAGSTSFSLTATDGIVNGTTYAVVVRATNSVGTSAASNSVTSPTVAPPARAAVTNLVATPSAGQLAITWTAPTGPAPIGYRIAVTIGGTLVGGSVFVVDAATTSITRTGLATGAYSVAVEPLHAFPFTAATATVQATVPAPATTTTTTSPSSTTTTVAASSTTTTIVGAGGPTTTVRAITLPGLLPATGASGTATIVFWSLLLLVFGRMAILFARPVRVLPARP